MRERKSERLSEKGGRVREERVRKGLIERT